MLKLKQMLSGILAAGMLAAAVPTGAVQAEENFDISDESYKFNSWTLNFTDNFNYNDNIVQPTKKYARNGGYALFVDYNDTEVSNTYIVLKNGEKTLTAGEYTIEFWAKGSFVNANAIHTGVYWPAGGYADIGNFSKDSATDDGWTRYYKTITLSDGGTFPFQINFQSVAEMVIDDIKFYKNDVPDVNLLIDGGFDDVTKLDIAENKYGICDWTVEKANIGDNFKDSRIFAEITDKDAYNEGGKSLHVVFPLPKAIANTYVRYNHYGATFASGTKYHLSLKAKGNFEYFAGGLAWNASFDSNNAEKNPLENGWTLYEWDLTPNGDTDRFRLDFDRKIYDLYIDDIIITAPGSDVNMLSNSSFEKVYLTSFDMQEEREKLASNSWNISYTANVDRTKNYIQPTKKYARTGDYAMYINYEDEYAGSTYMLLKNKNKPALTAGDYVMEFYAMGEAVADAAWLGLYWGDYAYRLDLADKKWTKSFDEDGWIKYYYSFNIPEDDTQKDFGLFIQRAAEMVIDDMKLYKTDAPDVNLLDDGGFEQMSEISINTELVNPIAYAPQHGEAVSLSWTNPDSQMISDINIYVDGEEYTAFTPDTAAIAVNECVINNLKNGQKYEFEIIPVINGEEYPVVLSAIPNNYWDGYNLGDWTVEFGDNVPSYSNSKPEIVTEDGNSYLRLASNANAKKYASNVYIRVAQTVTLNKNKNYRVVGKYKLEGTVSHLALVEEGGGSWYSPDILAWGHSEASGEWKNFSIDLDTTYYDKYSADTYEAVVKIVCDKIAGAVMLDDIGVYEIDEFDTTEVCGDNLLKNGGFDYDDYEVEDAVFKLVEGETKTEIDAIQAGTIEVTTKINNYSMGDNFKPTVVIALYSNDGLESVVISDNKIPEPLYNVPTGRFTTTVTVPESTGYEIKVMYLDSFSTMKPLDMADRLAAKK